MAKVRINTAFNVPINFDLAGLDKRFLAWVIDLAVRFVYIIIVNKLIINSIYYNDSLTYEAIQEQLVIYKVILYLPIYFYFLSFEIFFHGQSVGKSLFKIRVASIDGYKPTTIQYLIRWVLRLVDVGILSIVFLQLGGLLNTYIGWLLAIPNLIAIIILLNSNKQQRLGDLASGTVVIRLQPQVQLTDTIFENVSKAYTVRYPNVIKLSDRDITIIKNSILTYEKTGNDNTIWLIAEKLQKVLDIKHIDHPYDMLNTVVIDYSYVTTN